MKKDLNTRKTIRRLLLSLAMAAAMALNSGPARSAEGPGERVKPGDHVGIFYTCRTETGQVVATNRDDPVPSGFEKEKPIFKHRFSGQAVAITAGSGDAPDDWNRGIEANILNHLAGKITGMRRGESAEFVIRARETETISTGDTTGRILRLSRILSVPLKIEGSEEQYRRTMGKAPVKGARFPYPPGFEAIIEKAGGGTVILALEPPGETVRTDFGPGTVTREEDRYRVNLDARIGTLVASGPFLGRIVSADDKQFAIDYGHPFGGQALKCRVDVSEEKTAR